MNLPVTQTSRAQKTTLNKEYNPSGFYTTEVMLPSLINSAQANKDVCVTIE